MRFSWLICLFFFPGITLAQNGIITGKVTRADNKAPLSLVNVFLSNTTFGTSTASDGTFTLSHLKPGQYTLAVSIIGYEEYSTTVSVAQEPINLNVELSPKVTELHEVIVTTPANWKKNYDQFVKEFIGTDENAKQCYVLNPHVVNLVYHKAQQELEAYTDDFLVIDNLALGYRIKFLLEKFTNSKLTDITGYRGQRLFQELPGSKRQVKKWKKKREEAYYGSPMHFYRSLYTNKLDSDGFIIMKLSRLTDPNHEHLDRNPVPLNTILFKTRKDGIYAVNFTDCLYIIYTKKHEEMNFKYVYRPLDMENFETSVISITKPYLFDTNGIVFGESTPLYDGTWSKSKLSDLLPVDYTPGD